MLWAKSRKSKYALNAQAMENYPVCKARYMHKIGRVRIIFSCFYSLFTLLRGI